jgi:hypothetical protein
VEKFSISRRTQYGLTSAAAMVKHRRESKPRKRTARPLWLRDDEDGPAIANEPPKKTDGGWLIPAPVSSRLYQKSALGKTLTDGGILVVAEEVLFCHWHRHFPLPSKTWIEDTLSIDERLVQRSVVFEHIRSGGERLVPASHLSHDYTPSTWALRWSRENHPSDSEPCAEVRWALTEDILDWEELRLWVLSVSAAGREAELAIIDQEMDVTMYRLAMIDPTGTNNLPKRENIRDLWQKRISHEGGWFIADSSIWSERSLGFDHLSGRMLRQDEADWIDGVDNRTTSLFDDLLRRGLIMRPGFKYGCRWRIYDDWVEDAHAPWLLQMVDEASGDWQGICLCVRLAEGVSKRWVCAMDGEDNTWSFLEFRRWLPGRI